jgi:glucokinase
MTAPGPTDTLSLVADIGGTNTRVALARGRRSTPPACAATATPSIPGSASVIAAYLDRAAYRRRPHHRRLRRGRGPVRDGVVQLTNLDWRIDRDALGASADGGQNPPC